jgi:hypothetical protein
VVLNGVPEFVRNDQLTEVVEEILLPVEINVNKTVEPAQTFKLVPICKGFVEKLAFNCPQTLPKFIKKRRNNTSIFFII